MTGRNNPAHASTPLKTASDTGLQGLLVMGLSPMALRASLIHQMLMDSCRWCVLRVRVSCMSKCVSLCWGGGGQVVRCVREKKEGCGATRADEAEHEVVRKRMETKSAEK